MAGYQRTCTWGSAKNRMTDYKIFAGRAPEKGCSATSNTIVNTNWNPGSQGVQFTNLSYRGFGLSDTDFYDSANTTLFEPKQKGTYEVRCFIALPGGNPPDAGGYYVIALVEDTNQTNVMYPLAYQIIADTGGSCTLSASVSCDPLLESAIHVEVQRVTSAMTPTARNVLTSMFQLDVIRVD